MRWPWQRKTGCSEAEAAKQAAEAQWPEVRRVSESLRRQRETNHFGEAIERIMRGGHA